MGKELVASDLLAQEHEVIVRMLKGTDPTTIAREMGIKRVEVLKHIQTWKDTAANIQEIKDRAREALINADQHYNMLVAKLWETVEQTDLGGDYKTKNAVLKNIADVEAKRIDFLQKAGLLDDAELGDMVAETEEKLAKMKDLLRTTAANCDKCRIPVARGLAVIFEEPAVVVTSEVISQASV